MKQMSRWVALLCVWIFAVSPPVSEAQGYDEAQGLLQDEENTIDIVKEYSASVVAINVTVKGRRLNPLDEPQEEGGGGSGFIVDGRNRVITNFHVVGMALRGHSTELIEGAAITITLSGDPDTAYPMRVVGAMLDYDLALLEPVQPEALPRGIRPIPIGDSDQVRVGQKVIAIGNPFGLQSTVTTGIVSAIERGGLSVFGMEIPFIQTDAAINPGNSGGPLLNSKGEVIGINNAILSPSGTFSGVGLAVPSNLLAESLADLENGGLSGLMAAVIDPSRPRLGISSELSIDEYPEELRREFNLPEEGAVITGVQANSPAAEAGLREPRLGVTVEGEVFPTVVDVIVGVDGRPVSSIQDLQRVVVEKAPGEEVNLRVWRDGEERTVSVAVRVLQQEPEQSMP